jgi:hypothetical protein
MFSTYQAPTHGYILKKWNTTGYRATAHAYMKREKLTEVEHINGRWYTLKEIELSMIN